MGGREDEERGQTEDGGNGNRGKELNKGERENGKRDQG